MAKKKGGGKGKNSELRGGKNTLPKTDKGGIDHNKIVKQGEQESTKKWVDKKVVKDTTKTKSAIIPPIKKPKTPTTTPKKAIPVKGISKLKDMAAKSSVTKPTITKTNEQTKKAIVPAKGVNKLKVTAQAKTPKIQEAKPVKAKAPKKIVTKGR